jgi:hypothetical protein
MSERRFGLGRGKVKATAVERIDAVAKKHGASFVTAIVPGRGPSYWFACDGAAVETERAVWLALTRAGLAIAGRLSAEVFRKDYGQ